MLKNAMTQHRQVAKRTLRKTSSGSGMRSSASHAPLHARRCSAWLAQRTPRLLPASDPTTLTPKPSATPSCRRRLRRRRAPSPESPAAVALPASAAPHHDARTGTSWAPGARSGFERSPAPGSAGEMAVSTSCTLRARSASDTWHRQALLQNPIYMFTLYSTDFIYTLLVIKLAAVLRISER